MVMKPERSGIAIEAFAGMLRKRVDPKINLSIEELTGTLACVEGWIDKRHHHHVRVIAHDRNALVEAVAQSLEGALFKSSRTRRRHSKK